MSSQQTIPLPADERASRRGSVAPPSTTAEPLTYSTDDLGGALARHAGMILFGLAMLGFLARAAAIFVLHRWTQPNDIEHRQLAMSLLEHGTFYFRDFDYYGPSSVQSPPYPFLLAILFKLFGPQTKLAYIMAMLGIAHSALDTLEFGAPQTVPAPPIMLVRRRPLAVEHPVPAPAGMPEYAGLRGR